MGITYDSQPVTDFVASLVEGILKLVPMVSFNLSLVATRAQRLTLAHSYEQKHYNQPRTSPKGKLQVSSCFTFYSFLYAKIQHFSMNCYKISRNYIKRNKKYSLNL